MFPSFTFPMVDQAFMVNPLQPEHMPLLQELCERCADFVELVEGTEVSPHAAHELYTEMPPGRSLEDKLLLGVFDHKGALVAVLEAMRSYPESGTWWIGLLMLAPKVRGQGLGRKLVDGFYQYVRLAGGSAIMLGVVEENTRASHFWEQQRFRLVRQTEPRPFGKKVQTVFVMRREVLQGE